eukprot:scaffold31731_cov48-Attheya_sp.AAC.2
MAGVPPAPAGGVPPVPVMVHEWNPRRNHAITYAVDKTPISLTTLINPTTPPFRKMHAEKHSQ